MDILEEIEQLNLKSLVNLANKMAERAVALSTDATLDTDLANAIADLEAARARIDTLDAS
jgi:hypothetical protein